MFWNTKAKLKRRNRDLFAPGSQTWGAELLGFCQQADLLILNGRTPGDEYGQFTFQNAKGCCSTIDYFVASAQVKETWTQKRNVELCELSAKDPSQFWKAFKAPQSNACPVELSTHFDAFRALMGAKLEPQSAPQRPADSGAGGTWCPWQILDIIKSPYAHDSAAVHSLQGISAIFRCLMGVKQGCPLSPTLFGAELQVLGVCRPCH
ncbi:TPA: hypothetical protein ACH3X1_007298 [Trebouxia sp. C0004]